MIVTKTVEEEQVETPEAMLAILANQAGRREDMLKGRVALLRSRHKQPGSRIDLIFPGKACLKCLPNQYTGSYIFLVLGV